MKKLHLLALIVLIGFTACRKTGAVAPANVDQNYDASNRIFRIKASATMGYTVTLSDVNPSSPGTPYNYQQATQSGDYDYGFTPVIGHIINVSLQSPKGVISASAYYKGVKLTALTVKNTDGGGTTADFSYTVKD